MLANLGTLLHGLIVRAQPSALLGAGAADSSAGAARLDMLMRPEQHGVSARLADARAREQEGDVLLLGMLATKHQAVLYRLEADGVATEALLDTLTHLLGQRHSGMGHVILLKRVVTTRARRPAGLLDRRAARLHVPGPGFMGHQASFSGSIHSVVLC